MNIEVTHCEVCKGVGGFYVEIREGDPNSRHKNLCHNCNGTGHIIKEISNQKD